MRKRNNCWYCLLWVYDQLYTNEQNRIFPVESVHNRAQKIQTSRGGGFLSGPHMCPVSPLSPTIRMSCDCSKPLAGLCLWNALILGSKFCVPWGWLWKNLTTKAWLPRKPISKVTLNSYWLRTVCLPSVSLFGIWKTWLGQICLRTFRVTQMEEAAKMPITLSVRLFCGGCTCWAAQDITPYPVPAQANFLSSCTFPALHVHTPLFSLCLRSRLSVYVLWVDIFPCFHCGKTP